MTVSVLPMVSELHLLIAQQRPADEDVTAGPLGFVVFILLAAALAVLYFSLRKQLRRVDFEEQPERPRRGTSPGGGSTAPDSPTAPDSEPR